MPGAQRGAGGGQFGPPSVRYQRWDLPNQVRCSRDHHIREDFFVIDHGGMRCKHKDPDTHQECGEILYLLAVEGLELVYFAAVTLEEMRQLQKLRTVKNILRFLGGALPPSDPPKR